MHGRAEVLWLQRLAEADIPRRVMHAPRLLKAAVESSPAWDDRLNRLHQSMINTELGSAQTNEAGARPGC